MIGGRGREGNRDVQVIIGVDTHQVEDVAVAIDRQGVLPRRTSRASDYARIRRTRMVVPEFGGIRGAGSKARVPTALASPVS